MRGGETELRVEGLSRSFGELVAVNDLSFSVAHGELFGLLGPDGAGKTTTLRLLAGVLRPTSGDVLYGEVSVVRDPERVKPHLAYMSQRFGLYTDLTVMENLEFYADLYLVPQRERRARLERLFEFSRLGPFKDRLAGALSGGMKQKLGLSCALIHQPRVLLLDEPTFGVDPISRRELWLIIHEMVEQGVTVVVSTSYLDEAERFDRVLTLHRGRMLTLDRPEALQAHLEGAVLELAVDDPRQARDVCAAVPGVRWATVEGDRVRLLVRSAREDGDRAERALSEAGVKVRAREEVPASLEDVFIERVGGTGE